MTYPGDVARSLGQVPASPSVGQRTSPQLPFHAAELTQKVTAAKIYPDQDRIVYVFFGFGTGFFG